jgi:hypothetical protein
MVNYESSTPSRKTKPKYSPRSNFESDCSLHRTKPNPSSNSKWSEHIVLKNSAKRLRMDIDSKATWRSSNQTHIDPLNNFEPMDKSNAISDQTNIVLDQANKPLIVLEIKYLIGLIVRRNDPKDYLIDKEYAKIRTSDHFICLRPGVKEFLNFLIEDYQNIAIWTSLEEKNAKAILGELGNHIGVDDIESKFKFIWYRSKCQPDPENGKYAVIKNVDQILSDPDKKLDKSRIIIYDNSSKTVRHNQNIREVRSFDVSKPGDKYLYELLNDFRNGNF